MKDQMENSNAGLFSTWLHLTQVSLQGGEPVDVPCGSCAACCKSGVNIAVSRLEIEENPSPGENSRVRALQAIMLMERMLENV